MKKTVKVVMLPTEKASNLYKDGYGKLHLHIVSDTLNSHKQHLYLVSNEDIKQGDWYIYNINNNSKNVNWTFKKCLTIENIEGVGTYYDGYHHIWCKKIIVTTDISLSEVNQCDGCKANMPLRREDNVHDDGSIMGIGCTAEEYIFIPKIHEPFIKEYVKVNGKIDEVEVEYELKCESWCEGCKAFDWSTCNNKYKLKLTDNNFVIIHQLEEKMYSKLDVLKAIKWADDTRCEIDRVAIGLSKENADNLVTELMDPEKWIKDNL